MKWKNRMEIELAQENQAYLDKLHPFLRLVDNPFTYILLLVAASIITFSIGFFMGVML